MAHLPIVRAAMVVTLAVFGFGCSVFLPSSPKSFVSKEEHVSLRMLTLADFVNADGVYNTIMCAAGTDNTTPVNLGAQYEVAFGIDLRPKPVEPKFAPLAPLATFAAGLAIDAIVAQIQKEATRYEAQFGITEAFSGFWKAAPPLQQGEQGQAPARVQTTVRESVAKAPDPRKPDELVPHTVTETVTTQVTVTPRVVQNYVGFEVRRTVADGCAFLLVVGIAPSPDQQMFRLAPLVFITNRAKAKVLADDAWTWLPPMIFGKLFGTPGHHMDSQADIQIDASWRGADQALHTSTVAAVPMKFLSYDIANPLPRLAKPGTTSGWLLAVPISYQADGTVALVRGEAYGTFSVKVLVTERDKSNAKELITQGATLLQERKSDILKRLPGAK